MPSEVTSHQTVERSTRTRSGLRNATTTCQPTTARVATLAMPSMGSGWQTATSANSAAVIARWRPVSRPRERNPR